MLETNPSTLLRLHPMPLALGEAPDVGERGLVVQKDMKRNASQSLQGVPRLQDRLRACQPSAVQRLLLLHLALSPHGNAILRGPLPGALWGNFKTFYIIFSY
jgi:hypothetical protein